MPLVFGAIAPHAGIAIAEACTPDERDLALATRSGMEELGRRFDAASPEAVVVVTPHNVHVSNAFGVVVAGRVAGALSGMDPTIALDVRTDGDIAWGILGCLGLKDLPSVGVSFGSNDPDTAVAPMDWACSSRSGSWAGAVNLRCRWSSSRRPETSPPTPTCRPAPRSRPPPTTRVAAWRSSPAPTTATRTAKTARTATTPPRRSTTR